MYIPPLSCFINNHYGFWKLIFGVQAKSRIKLKKVFIILKCISISFLLAWRESLYLLPPERVALQFRTCEKHKLENISQFLKVVTFLDFIYWFDWVFGKSRQRISTRLFYLVKLETLSLAAHFLTVCTLEEVRR